MTRKFLIIFNPSSGKKRAISMVEKVRNTLESEGHVSEILQTSPKEDFLKNTLVTWDDSITDVVAIGGDGTLNLVANILHKKKAVLSIIPAGTGNDFVKTISLGKKIDQQIETILSGKVVEIDAGICNDRVFVNGLGLGFDGQIVYDNLNRKSILKGHAKYYAQVLRILATFRPQKVEYSIDGQQYDDKILLLTIANGTTFGGGFRLTPMANNSDGQLDIAVIRQISPLRRFWEVMKLTKGTHGKLNEVNFYHGKKVIVEGNSSIKAHIDGEYFGAPPYHIEVLPELLKIRVRV